MSDNIARSTALVSALTMISRILGLIRDMVLMSVFGAGGLMDAFLVAFKIPNFLRRLFAEGAFSQAFVPVLSEYKTQRGLLEVQVLVSRVAAALLLILSGCTALVIAFAPAVIGLFAVGFYHQPEKFATATTLLRLVFPYFLFISLTAFAGGVLQSYERFVAPAIAPVLLNVSMIIGALLVAPMLDKPIMALGYAVVVAGLLQLAIQLPPLYQQKLLVVPRLDRHHEGVRRILKLMLPAIFGVSVMQINLLLNTVFASMMINGSVSWLYTAERMSELPIGLIGVAIGTVILPSLSASIAKADITEFQRTLDWATKLVVLVGVPASVALVMISDVLMIALFRRGEFSLHDALMSGLALKCMAAGILSFMLIKVFAPAFFARQDSKTPVKIGVVSLLANILLSGIFVALFYALHIPLHAALSLGTTGASVVNAAMLYGYLHRDGIYRMGRHWRGLGVQFGVANIAMIIALGLGVHYFPVDASQMVRVLALIALCVTGMMVYGLALVMTGFNFTALKQP